MSARAAAVPLRTMSERQRALYALAGRIYPRVGDRAEFRQDKIDAAFEDDADREVEVTHVSVSGQTIWARFMSGTGRRRYGDGPHRFRRDSLHFYYSNGSVREPVAGYLHFW